MEGSHQHGHQAPSEGGAGSSVQQGDGAAPSPTHSTSTGKKRQRAETISNNTPKSKRRARPPNITVSPATPTRKAKRGADNDDDAATPTPHRYSTRSKSHLSPLSTIKTPITAINTLSLATPKPIAKPPFQLLGAFTQHPELILRLATTLEPKDMLSLYAISQPFHMILNSHFTTYIRQSAALHAPEAGYIFPWRCYRSLTIKDPGFRLNSIQAVRDVPSIKWLRMVSARHKAVCQIVEAMRESGHTFVGREEDTIRALKKVWFTMDLPRNGVRIGVIHNAEYWTDQDLFMATFFLVKLDMRLGDPVEGAGETGLRKLMLGQRGLLPLRDLLLGKLKNHQIVKMWVAYDYRPRPENAGRGAYGIPPQHLGRGCLESWGLGTERLLRPDQLQIRENVRRNMNLHMRYLDMVRWGYKMQANDERTRKAREEGEGLERLEDLEELEETADRMLERVVEEQKVRNQVLKEAREVREADKVRKKLGLKKNVWKMKKKTATSG